LQMRQLAEDRAEVDALMRRMEERVWQLPCRTHCNTAIVTVAFKFEKPCPAPGPPPPATAADAPPPLPNLPTGFTVDAAAPATGRSPIRRARRHSWRVVGRQVLYYEWQQAQSRGGRTIATTLHAATAREERSRAGLRLNVHWPSGMSRSRVRLSLIRPRRREFSRRRRRGHRDRRRYCGQSPSSSSTPAAAQLRLQLEVMCRTPLPSHLSSYVLSRMAGTLVACKWAESAWSLRLP
jgi:hypothetical protein